MSHTAIPVINLMGPTASGKTSLAIELAQRLNGEIVSVDSALIYTGMDIGTAKPTAAELSAVQHWLIDIVDPAESYSVADFCRDAFACIDDIRARGKVPMLVGGTMMYYNALINGMSMIPESTAEIRAKVHQQAEQLGWNALHAQLSGIDPVVAARVHPNDPQRIGRALEVYYMTGKPLSEWQQHKTPSLQQKVAAPVYQFAIAPTDRKVLHARIQKRFELMLEHGFIDEVKHLRQRADLHIDLPAIRCVGYRQVWQYLEGDFSYAEMLEKGVAATRQLAKRQFTWLRGWDDLHWLDTFSEDNVDKIAQLVSN